MKAGQRATLLLSLALIIMLSVCVAEAGTGTLKANFKYKDPATGSIQNLSYGFIYLHSATKPPPMEKFFSKADYILGPSAADGSFTVSVPEGTYYIRITRRKVVQGSTRPYGPPEEGDYTWMQTIPITVAANATVDLGTKLAYPFTVAPITITGTVKSQNGTPLTGRYVRAQTEPCYDDGYNYNINQCGPVKYLALQPTDANGKYTLQLRDPGTYYIYTSPCITADYDQYTGNRCTYTAAPGPVTVTRGENKTVNMTVFAY